MTTRMMLPLLTALGLALLGLVALLLYHVVRAVEALPGRIADELRGQRCGWCEARQRDPEAGSGQALLWFGRFGWACEECAQAARELREEDPEAGMPPRGRWLGSWGLERAGQGEIASRAVRARPGKPQRPARGAGGPSAGAGGPG